MSGADISGVVKEAALLCIKENFESDKLTIGKKHVVEAIKKIHNMKDNN